MTGKFRCGLRTPEDSAFSIGSQKGVLLSGSCAMSQAVSVATQKKGGLSAHPICSNDGVTSIIGLLLVSLDSTQAKFYTSSS